MSYLQHGVKLTDGQKQKLARAYKNNEAITIRLSNSQLTGPDEMMLTKTQINRIRKAKANGLGLEIEIADKESGETRWFSLFQFNPVDEGPRPNAGENARSQSVGWVGVRRRLSDREKGKW